MLDAPVAPALSGDTIPAADRSAESATPARKLRDYSQGRSRDRGRYRPGTREARRLVGRRKDRMAFLELLARHGDPALAADELGLPLFMLFRHRDADQAFAAEWLAAVNYAWERVESRVLAALLEDGDASATANGSSKTVGSGQIDIRLALAIVNRRDKPVTHTGSARPADGASAARLRAELRALAGLTEAG